jgi:hypothetical protein
MLDGLQSDIRRRPATVQVYLPSGSRGRILPGAPGFMAPELGFVPLPCQMPSLSFRAPRGQPGRPQQRAPVVSRQRSAGRSARFARCCGPYGPSVRAGSRASGQTAHIRSLSRHAGLEPGRSQPTGRPYAAALPAVQRTAPGTDASSPLHPSPRHTASHWHATWCTMPRETARA